MAEQHWTGMTGYHPESPDNPERRMTRIKKHVILTPGQQVEVYVTVYKGQNYWCKATVLGLESSEAKLWACELRNKTRVIVDEEHIRPPTT